MPPEYKTVRISKTAWKKFKQASISQEKSIVEILDDLAEKL